MPSSSSATAERGHEESSFLCNCSWILHLGTLQPIFLVSIVIYAPFMKHPQKVSSCTNSYIRSLMLRVLCHWLWWHFATLCPSHDTQFVSGRLECCTHFCQYPVNTELLNDNNLFSVSVDNGVEPWNTGCQHVAKFFLYDFSDAFSYIPFVYTCALTKTTAKKETLSCILVRQRTCWVTKIWTLQNWKKYAYQDAPRQ